MVSYKNYPTVFFTFSARPSAKKKFHQQVLANIGGNITLLHNDLLTHANTHANTHAHTHAHTHAMPPSIHSTLSTMERNPEDSMIQERGCDTIHMIAKGKPADRKKAAGEQVARAVVAAMQRHTSSVHVQVSSACTPDAAPRCCSLYHTVYTLLMVCMILHCTCTAHSHALSNTLYIVLQEYGCLAIESLAFPENCLAVAKAGAVEVVVSAMNRHVKNTDVQYSGCLALQRLAHNDGAGASAADAGIDVDLILDGICSHSRRSPERALALKMLARDSAIEGTAKSSIAAAGGIDAKIGRAHVELQSPA